uniref:NADH-ubiquinone oxidoreductase chain 4 n=1 Tax=Sipalinus gigas TaxID=1078824 RepID=A0A7H1DNR3_9CUCU|nr:NADH dehydrogenase subunit 4 [Sipalinus gigas]QNS38621.1 NADH dehydrogenase subunit 4 [Sipalinus gigas]
MMGFLLMLVFLIPLSVFIDYWLFMWVFFVFSFMFIFKLSFGASFMYLSMGLGMDFLSYSLILLSFWICSLMILASEKIYKTGNYPNLFLFMVLFLLISLYLAFSSLNAFVFYLFFEASLIPTFILIIGWGYQPERISAGTYLLFYTLLVSLPMMLGLFHLYKVFYSLDFYFLDKSVDSVLLYLCVNMVFFVKIPMFLVHLWLPKAHVEAPISGSMILAGVMLKLGGYGMLRMMKLFTEVGLKINVYFISLCLVGGFIVSLMCMRQSDMKALIAYSSIAHMGLVMAGILTLNLWGFCGSLILMLAHGLCSSGLFCLANISYERVGSRSLYLNKGMINLIPSLSLWWFLFCACNMAAPPSLNLLGEIFLLNSLIAYSGYSMIFLSLLSFFSAGYSLFLYSYTQHGKFYSGLYSFYTINCREFLLLFLHWLPLNAMILKSDMFLAFM